ncbi:hypothetical protein [Granulicella arctica]|uniref:Uncharacterized protein n=1 Tax=Granulicella arctica TaxID=940613 RepID=A0A7Y9TSD6_9BACT|nr:hypothetical protein [Granulicella arctica]NYF78913.1 hypothetical protein [Granulicella arctica]
MYTFVLADEIKEIFCTLHDGPQQAVDILVATQIFLWAFVEAQPGNRLRSMGVEVKMLKRCQ